MRRAVAIDQARLSDVFSERNAQTFFTSRRVPFNFGSAATRDPWSVTRQIARVGPGGRSMEAGVESPIQPERKNEAC
jgi:endonuclease YncB( thermonuclease family)